VSFHVVIPARFASTRLPGKPLVDINGLPMIVRVARQASASGAREVVVATDDERIARAVRDAGFAAELTRTDHVSGSDRVMEVAERRGWEESEVVINVQGDEPLIPPSVIRQVASCLTAEPGFAAATLCEHVEEADYLFDPNVVKVVCGLDHGALYFSRAPIPYARDAFAQSTSVLPPGGHWRRHIGIYAYRVGALRRFVTTPPGVLEQLESLEQLRLLENGMRIRVEVACEPVPGGVDTPADLDRVRRALGGA
jgi:3-deoxy-manno-octulosonate cytidylyltransferase (CMP-KDO synthetase)